MDTAANNFLGLEPELAAYESARYAVLPIPYDATVSFQTGTRRGPDAIIAASQQVEWNDEALGAGHLRAGIATLDAVAPNVTGPAAMHEDIYQAARVAVHDGKFLIGLGGEHGVTSGLVRAVIEQHPKLSVLQIDAHADLRASYQGTPFSHASVMRRILDMGASIVPVGIRSFSEEEALFMHETGIEPITPRRVRSDPDWIDAALAGLGKTVFVTIDIDGFDPAYAPGTGTPEPGGLDWFQVCDLLSRVCHERTVVAGDIVEVIPIPGQSVTEFLAARLACKLIALTAG
jgi:agmatinase